MARGVVALEPSGILMMVLTLQGELFSSAASAWLHHGYILLNSLQLWAFHFCSEAIFMLCLQVSHGLRVFDRRVCRKIGCLTPFLDNELGDRLCLFGALFDWMTGFEICRTMAPFKVVAPQLVSRPSHSPFFSFALPLLAMVLSLNDH